MNLFGTKTIINDTSINILFGNTQNYLSTFDIIHNSVNSEDFIEMYDIDIEDFTDTFLSKNHISLDDIKNDKMMLKLYIKEAKKETNITLTDLSKFLGLSRNIVGYQYRKP